MPVALERTRRQADRVVDVSVRDRVRNSLSHFVLGGIASDEGNQTIETGVRLGFHNPVTNHGEQQPRHVLVAHSVESMRDGNSPLCTAVPNSRLRAIRRAFSVRCMAAFCMQTSRSVVSKLLVQFGGLPVFQRRDGLKAVRWLGS
jgi:hypothetical protein